MACKATSRLSKQKLFVIAISVSFNKKTIAKCRLLCLEKLVGDFDNIVGTVEVYCAALLSGYSRRPVLDIAIIVVARTVWRGRTGYIIKGVVSYQSSR